MTDRLFAHAESPLVDVLPNADGEFVQVWDAPAGTPGRRVSLSYQRNRGRPHDITSTVLLSTGPWEAIEVTGPRRTLYYRGRRDEPRHEDLLPSGRVLVHDFRAGLVVERRYTPAFDRTTGRPKGRDLGTRALAKLQAERGQWFLSHYQQIWRDDLLVSNTLVLVESFRGHELLEFEEPAHGG